MELIIKDIFKIKKSECLFLNILFLNSVLLCSIIKRMKEKCDLIMLPLKAYCSLKKFNNGAFKKIRSKRESLYYSIMKYESGGFYIQYY